MDKAFFTELDARIRSYAERATTDEQLQAEIVLVTGRVIAVDRIVETADAWLQVDGRDLIDDDREISAAFPLHQVAQVRITRARPRAGNAGFRPIR